ncbi:MAG: hypothetical protein KKC46_19490 [Proteobacteria bacterium]|nr:hypothetical protein [Pseudomonadota bacterium]
MPKYYHLSGHDHLREIVEGNSDFAKGQISPRIPTDCFGEDKTPRVCFSPSVWQCILSKPIDETVYKLDIYEISVDHLSDPVGLVADIDMTGEKWITNDDMLGYAKPVELKRIGRVFIDQDTKKNLKLLYKQGKLYAFTDEAGSVWKVENNCWQLAMKI